MKDLFRKRLAKILNDNPKEVEQYLAGKETLLQWFMGQVARATKGKADPTVARELLVKVVGREEETNPLIKRKSSTRLFLSFCIFFVFCHHRRVPSYRWQSLPPG